jgi:hypothetical protein
MPISEELKRYQLTLVDLLSQVYQGIRVQKEWGSKFGAKKYSPRLDVAVGPFATTDGQHCISEYDRLMDSSRTFINQLIEFHLLNIRGNITDQSEQQASQMYDMLKERNPNARCLMAIEIENQVGRKHLMGGAINAASLGRIGIAVGWTSDKLQAFINLKAYLDYLTDVKKNAFNVPNLLILGREQLLDAVRNASLTTRSRGGREA